MANLTTFRTRIGGAPFTVGSDYADRFRGLADDLEGAGYKIMPDQSGGYNDRNIAGTNTKSQHAFGRAIDVNWTDNPRGSPGKINADLARKLASKGGMTWGGDWSNPDPMHFEVGNGPFTPPTQTAAAPTAPMALGGPAQPPPSPATPTPSPTSSGPQTMPMPDYIEQAAYKGLTPQQVATRRAMAQSLLKEGMDTSPVQGGAWSAAARALAGGLGGYQAGQADQGEAEGLAAARRDLNAKLTAALTGDMSPEQLPTALMSTNNPWSTAPETGAKMAEPIIQAQTQYKMRAAVAGQYGLQQGTQAWKRFVLTGQVPSPKDSYLAIPQGGSALNIDTGQTIGQEPPFSQDEIQYGMGAGPPAGAAAPPAGAAPTAAPAQGRPPVAPAQPGVAPIQSAPGQGAPAAPAPPPSVPPPIPQAPAGKYKTGQIIGGVPVGTKAVNPANNHAIEWNGETWAEPAAAGPQTTGAYKGGLPAAGDAMALDNPGSPSMRTRAPYASPEDMILANKLARNPRAAAAIEKTPGHAEAISHAQTVGKNMGDLENTQRVVLGPTGDGASGLLGLIDDFEKAGAAAGPATLKQATGPDYAGEASPVVSWMLPNTSSSAYQAFARQMPDILGGTDASYNKNVELQHLKKAVANVVKSVPGAGRTAQTDQAQRVVEDMLDEAMKTTDPEMFFKVIHDAKNSVRAIAGLQPLPPRQRYMPQEWGQ